MIDNVDQLRGTSTAKVAALLQLVRDDGKTSLVLGLAERLPVIGDTVKFLLYELPKFEPPALDALIDRAANVVLCLKSDEGGSLPLDPCSGCGKQWLKFASHEPGSPVCDEIAAMTEGDRTIAEPAHDTEDDTDD